MTLEKTSFTIFNSSAGKTIVFNNIYFIDGQFVFNGSVNESEISTYPNVHYRHTNFELWKPKIAELSDFECQEITDPCFFIKETMHYHPGHTLMDDIFSMFYTLHRCNVNYNPIIPILDTNNKIETYYDCKNMFNTLFGNKAITLTHFSNTHTKVCIKTLVVGNSDSGFSIFDYNYVMPYKDDIWKKFRNAYYEQAKIKLDHGNKCIYVNSGNEDISSDLKNTLEANNIEIINWSATNDIVDQLDIMKNVKLYISNEGSASLNAVFLPDNSNMINLGKMYADGNYVSIGSCDDSVWPALTYINVFYFEDYFYVEPIISRLVTPNGDQLIELVKSINEAKEDNHIILKRKEIYDRFGSIVIDKITSEVKLHNFSLNARLFLEHFPNIQERIRITESFKRGNRGFTMNNQIRPFRTKGNK